MPDFTGTNGNDTLTGTSGSDTINPLLGRDTVDGLGDSDTLVVDYHSAFVDPYAGAAPANVPSVVTSNGGSFSGSIRTVDFGNYVNFSNIEHLQVSLDFWHNTFILDGAALALGATIQLDGGLGTDTLEANLSALANVDLTFADGVTTASFGTIVNFEAFRLNLTAGADHVTTGAGKDTLTGNGGDDVLNSGAGDDILNGGSGTNILNAGDGDDYITSSGSDTVEGGGGFGFDRWIGDYGASAANLVFVRDQTNGTATLSNGTTLSGIEQILYLTTGSGDDIITYYASEGGVIAAGAGDDTLNLTGSGYFSVVTNDGSGAFRGNLGNDQFSGVEHLNFVSGAGADSIIVNAAPLAAGATLSLDAGGGIDSLDIDLTTFETSGFVVAPNGTVATNIPISLSNFENYRINSGDGVDTIVTGGGADVIHTNGGNDIIDTGGGHDLLNGGVGADNMTGGVGDDVYYVDDAGDTVHELAGQGVDEIRTSLASYALGVTIENLSGLSADGQTLTGNGGDNSISGFSGNDILVGGAGIDILSGGLGNDILIGGTGFDAMAGGEGSDTYYVDAAGDSVFDGVGAVGRDVVYANVDWLMTSYSSIEVLSAADQSGTAPLVFAGNQYDQDIYGNAGNNLLQGGGGSDYLVGLGGDDSYIVAGSSDRIVEFAGQGRDIVYALGSYRLAAGASIEVLSAGNQSATLTIELVGNELDQDIYGNAGSNLLQGGGGNDYLIGLEGDDNYIVLGNNDRVVEIAGQGRDVVYTKGDYTLDPSVSVEILSAADQSATTAMRLTGSSQDQEIYGNAGANVLDGGGGTDYMGGLGGNDTYFVSGAGDHIIEAAGQGSRDVVYARASYTLEANQDVEVLASTQQTATTAMSLTGNNLVNELYGNDGANTLNGGAGSDYLMGFGGADIFAFTTTLGAGNVDQILDFNVADDTIALDDAVFTGLATGALTAGAFVNGSAAADADDRIVYNAAAGQILFDADGNGAGVAVLFATVSAATVLTASDFTVI